MKKIVKLSLVAAVTAAGLTSESVDKLNKHVKPIKPKGKSKINISSSNPGNGFKRKYR